MRGDVLYNDNDAYAATWLENLVEAGHIPLGVVDRRSILGFDPLDLAGFEQCHFFAGIGVWPAALAAAGWPAGRSVWTGSCPCQPFSAAGKRNGFVDPRHVWPAWFQLIKRQERRPLTIFGEQVASKDGLSWLDLVQDDLEGLGYAFGAVVAPAAGIGAPHIRSRTYWVAHALRSGRAERGAFTGGRQAPGRGGPHLVADAEHAGPQGRLPGRPDQGRTNLDRHAGRDSATGGLADAEIDRRNEQRGETGGAPSARGARHTEQPIDSRRNGWPGPVNGVWSDADWIFCRDSKWRPIEPGAFPLAHGAPARVGRLRAYGNALVLQAAVAFIESYLEVEAGMT